MLKAAEIISYEFDTRPGTGEAIDILPGLKWVRLPLPFMLGHINVWLLREEGGWLLVDTGIHTPPSLRAWEDVLAAHLRKAGLSRVLVTHLHPDHVGCAGWLCERFGVPLAMTREEYLLCRVLAADTGQPAPAAGRDFYHAAGFSMANMHHYIETFGAFGEWVAPLPLSYERLVDGMVFSLGDDAWQVIIGRGHSPEHACLYCERRGLLISGDQVLPTISSNVSVFPTEPAANPLADWFESLEHLQNVLPDDVLVLPAHGKPFRGVKVRLRELVTEHRTGLSKLHELCRRPQRAIDVFPALFKSRITESNLIMAAGEAVAHLNYLIGQGQMAVDRDEDGVHWYQSI